MRRAAGQDELAQRRELQRPSASMAASSRAVHAASMAGWRSAPSRRAASRARRRRRTARPARARGDGRSPGSSTMRARRAERGVELVHLAVGLDPQRRSCARAAPRTGPCLRDRRSSCRSSRQRAYQRHEAGRNARRGADASRSSRQTRSRTIGRAAAQRAWAAGLTVQRPDGERRAHPARRRAGGTPARRARRRCARGAGDPLGRGEARARAPRSAATRAIATRSSGRSRGSRRRRWRGCSPRRRSRRCVARVDFLVPEGGGRAARARAERHDPGDAGLRGSRRARLDPRRRGGAREAAARGRGARRALREPHGAAPRGARRVLPRARRHARAPVDRARRAPRRRADRRAPAARRALPADGARGEEPRARGAASPSAGTCSTATCGPTASSPPRRSRARCSRPVAFVLANPVNGLLEAKALFARLSECAEDAALAERAGLDAGGARRGARGCPDAAAHRGARAAAPRGARAGGC